MPSYSGRFRYLEPDGRVAQSGPCQVAFETETFKLLPGAGSPLAFDLGDVDMFLPADFELGLTLYTGKKILLSHFGKAFQNLHHDLLEAYRKRLVQCLLLEDLKEIARFDGMARLESSRGHIVGDAEFRLYESNLAVLPSRAAGFHWRLAEIDAVRFDENNYAVELESGGARLTIAKLAKSTREFHDALLNALSRLAEKSAEAIRHLFPFLDPDQFQQVARIMKEGQSAPLARLTAIHPKIEQAVKEQAVDGKQQPYFERLADLTPPGSIYTGFKFIRNEGEPADSEGREAGRETAPEGVGVAVHQALSAPTEEDQGFAVTVPEDQKETILHWFFFPLATKSGAQPPSALVAWEATSKSGRATYFFRQLPFEESGPLARVESECMGVEATIQQLNRAIILLNFRREPIYLPEESLQMEPGYRRYAIACRKIPELRKLRAAFVGRVIHSSLQVWQKQVQEFLLRV